MVEPVLETEKSVVVALAVEEPIAKRILFVSPLLAWTESFANGVEVPTPNFPAAVAAEVYLRAVLK